MRFDFHPTVNDAIDRASSRYGVDPSTMRAIAYVESRGNPNARNPSSSAGGLYQFINSTARQYGLADKYDPYAASDAAARLAADNAAYLQRRLGRAPTAGELYLAHQQGAGGAAKLLANPDAPVESVIGRKAARLNAGAGLTAGQFAQRWTSKVDRLAGGASGAVAMSPVGSAVQDVLSRYASAYAPEAPRNDAASAIEAFLADRVRQLPDDLRAASAPAPTIQYLSVPGAMAGTATGGAATAPGTAPAAIPSAAGAFPVAAGTPPAAISGGSTSGPGTPSAASAPPSVAAAGGSSSVTYEVEGPDGTTYEVDGPPGASDAEIIAAVRAEIDGDRAAKIEAAAQRTAAQDNLVNRAVQSAVSAGTFGLSDKATAFLASQMSGVDYETALAVQRRATELANARSPIAAGIGTVGGAVVGGLGLAKGVLAGGRALSAARSPVAQAVGGVVQRAATLRQGETAANVGKIVGAGAAAGGLEGALREGEIIGSPGDVARGAAIGAVAAPIGAAAARGVAAGGRALAGLFRGSDAMGPEVADRLARLLPERGETYEQALGRLEQTRVDYLSRTGEEPTLLELLGPRKARDVGAILQRSPRVGDIADPLTEAAVARQSRTMDAAVERVGGRAVPDERLAAMTRDRFDDVMRRNGNMPVSVPADTIDALGTVPEWLARNAQVSPDVQKLQRIIEARAELGKSREKLAGLVEQRKFGGMAEEITNLDARLKNWETAQAKVIAELSDEDTAKAWAVRTRIGEMRANLADLKQAARNYATDKKIMPLQNSVNRMARTLAEFEEAGVQIPLSVANDLRKAGKRAVDQAARSDIPGLDEVYRDVQRRLAAVGTTEVPEYGDAVRDWFVSLSRGEAQATGRQAVAGTIPSGNLEVRLERGTLGDAIPRPVGAVRQGAREGATMALQEAARGLPPQVHQLAKDLSDNPGLRERMTQVFGPQAVEEMAAQGRLTRRSLESLRNARMPKEFTEERASAESQRLLDALAFIPSMGGAAKASLLTQFIRRFRLPSPLAERMAADVLDPARARSVLNELHRRGHSDQAILNGVVAATIFSQ